MANILIIDDDKRICDILSLRVEGLGHTAQAAFTLKDGEKKLFSENFDVVLLDVDLPDGNGLEALPAMREAQCSPEVIIMTAKGDKDGAALAIKSGAWDYIQKPFSKKEVNLHLSRALEFRAKKTAAGTVSLKREKVIGSSKPLSVCLDQVAQCSRSDINVLLTGETGTGKELFARVIHENSSRSEADFIIVDCAALPNNLIESVLFGHVKGAFTGADKDQAGLVKQADGGTLFLDEVGELPLSIQKTFLRTLQERRFRPVGSSRETASAFRLISATNRDLDAMVKKGRFRLDLLFRLRTFQVDLPPLRERTKDVNDLVQHYIYRICERHRIKIKGFDPEFLDFLTSYDWPGNVRELVNTLEKAIISDLENPTLYTIHLPADIRIHHAQAAVARKTGTNDDENKPDPEDETRLNFAGLLKSNPPMKDYRETVTIESETQYLKHLMSTTQYNVKKACRFSGLSPSRLYTLLRKYAIPVKQD